MLSQFVLRIKSQNTLLTGPVDIEGIEPANLVDVVCDNGYLLRVADEPGKLDEDDLYGAFVKSDDLMW